MPIYILQNLVKNGTIVSEKIWFEFLYAHDLGPGQEMILTFNTHIPSGFMNSIRCLLLPTLRSLAAIVSEQSTVFTFSHRKA